MSDPFATSQPIGLIEPIDLELDHVQNREIVALALTGIFNPMGPTFNAIALLRDEVHDFAYVIVASLNPFSQTRQLLARVEDHVESLCEVIPQLSRGEETPFVCLPTFTISPVKAEELREPLGNALGHLFRSIPPPEPLGKIVGGYAEHLGDPWARMPSMAEMMSAAKASSPFGTPPTEEEWIHWQAIMADQRHIVPEFRAIMDAWNGAIQNFGSGLPHMPLNEAAAELTAMGFPFFKNTA